MLGCHLCACHLQAFTDINFARDVTLQEKIGSGAFGSVYRGSFASVPFCQVVLYGLMVSRLYDRAGACVMQHNGEEGRWL